MLIAAETLSVLAWITLPPMILGPVVGLVVWANRHADRFRRLGAGRQILGITAAVLWGLVSFAQLYNWRHWLDAADVWLIREQAGGVVKTDWILIGEADYRLADGNVKHLVADAQHYRYILNDSPRTIRKTAVYYGPCPENSPYTRVEKTLAQLAVELKAAGLMADANDDIAPGSLVENPLHMGSFGGDAPPKETTIGPYRTPDEARAEAIQACHVVYWHHALPPQSGRP